MSPVVAAAVRRLLRVQLMAALAGDPPPPLDLERQIARERRRRRLAQRRGCAHYHPSG